MSKLKRTARIIIYTLVSALLASAQQAQTPQVSTVNVTPEAGRVRVAPVGSVSDLKLEVVNESGETIFEAAQGAREQIDWNMKDSAGVRVQPGTYTVTVSYTTQDGKARKRIEQVLLTDERTTGGAKESSAAAAGAPNPQPLVDGGGSTNRLAKFTDADTLTSSSIIDAGGNVSIGKLAAPVAGLRLEINGNTRITPSGGNGGFMQFGTPNGESGLTWSKSTTSRADIRFNGTALTLAAVTGANVPPGTNGIVLTRTGRVGIGTVNPDAAYKLHVVSDTTAILGHSTANSGVLGFGFNGVLGNGDSVGVWGQSFKSTGIAVYGQSSNGALAGRFDGPVQVNGTLAATGNVCAANIPCSSDSRLKLNVTGLNYGLDQLLRLRPVSWHWKSAPEGRLQMGLVAQEVEPVMPELVLKDADATKPLGLNYMALLPVMVKAAQEQQAQIHEQQKLIERLQARVSQLERSAKKRQQARARR